MSARPTLDRARVLGGRAARALSFVAPLLTRLAVGHAFWQSGAGKLANMERTTEFFAGLGIPAPHANAVFIANLEHYGGLLLIVGLATRAVAFLLSSTMVVALATAHRDDVVNALTGAPDAVGLTELLPFVLLLFLLWLVLFGPGAASADALVSRFIGPAGMDAASEKRTHP
jgi:putative oxidoreductase